jgi:AraC-like DNA-binding protein
MAESPAPPADLDLGELDAALRESAWGQWVEHSFPGLAVAKMAPSAGHGRQVALGPAQLWRIDAPTGLVVRRNGQAIHPAGDLIVSLQVSGTSHFLHQRGAQRSAPGSVTFAHVVDSPFELACESAATHLILHVPRQFVMATCVDLPSAQFSLYEAGAPGVSLLADTLVSLFTAAPKLQAQQARIALESLTLLLGVAGASTDQQKPPSSWRVQRALTTIAAQLAEPGLSAERVAASQRISRRRLDEIFSASVGRSVTAYIRERRLERAVELLLSARSQHTSIARVAEAAGFEDSAHFSHTFKAHFGMSPRAFKQARTRDRDE